MTTTGMNHFTILTDDVPRTVQFYGDLLGLTDGRRPPLGFPGAWLYAGSQAVLHVVGGRSRAELGRRHRPHGVFGDGSAGDARGTRCPQHRVPVPATERVGSLAGVLPRPEWRESRARFRAGGIRAAMRVAAMA